MLRPEFFLLFGFLVQLWYGTGGLVTPVAEKITVAEVPSGQNSKKQKYSLFTTPTARAYPNSALGVQAPSQTSADLGSGRNPAAGPSHAASAQTLWRLIWCFLRAVQCFYGPLQSVLLGGCFQKDLYTSMLCGILFLTGLLVLRVSYGWQKAAAISHPEYVYLAMQAQTGQYLFIQSCDKIAVGRNAGEIPAS